MRIALGMFLFLHGLAHLAGFVVPWRLMQPEGQPYRTTILRDALDLGATGIRLYGLGWLVLTLGFVAVGTALLLELAWWSRAAVSVAIVSSLFCMLGLPEAKIGLVLNVLLLAVLFTFGRQQGGSVWLTGRAGNAASTADIPGR